MPLARPENRHGQNRHQLNIEEAHCIPFTTLKHLKGLQEENTDGMSFTLSVILLGQTELRSRLSPDKP